MEFQIIGDWRTARRRIVRDCLVTALQERGHRLSLERGVRVDLDSCVWESGKSLLVNFDKQPRRVELGLYPVQQIESGEGVLRWGEDLPLDCDFLELEKSLRGVGRLVLEQPDPVCTLYGFLMGREVWIKDSPLPVPDIRATRIDQLPTRGVSYCVHISKSCWSSNSYRIFLPIAEMLVSYLQDRGYEAWISKHPFVNFETETIYLGANMAPDYVPKSAIIYDLEQHHDDREEEFRAYLQILRQRRVWNYSRRNIDWLRKRGIACTYVPIHYTPPLSPPIISKEERRWDVLFIGNPTQRRMEVLSTLSARGVRVWIASNSWGEELDRLIDQSEMVLSISQYEHSNIFPVARILPILERGRFILSEDFDDPEEHQYLLESGVVATCPYGRLVETVEEYLRTGRGREAERRIPFALRKRYLQLPIGGEELSLFRQLETSRCLRNLSLEVDNSITGCWSLSAERLDARFWSLIAQLPFGARVHLPEEWLQQEPILRILARRELSIRPIGDESVECDVRYTSSGELLYSRERKK